MNIDEIKSFLIWCRDNGVYHVELKDTLVADLTIKEPEQPKTYTPTNLDYIPTFSPDFVQTPFEVEEVKE